MKNGYDHHKWHTTYTYNPLVRKYLFFAPYLYPSLPLRYKHIARSTGAKNSSRGSTIVGSTGAASNILLALVLLGPVLQAPVKWCPLQFSGSYNSLAKHFKCI